MTEKQLHEWIDAGYIPVMGFSLLDKDQMCTLMFKLDYVREVSSWRLAEMIGRVISQELQLCRAHVKEFYAKV